MEQNAMIIFVCEHGAAKSILAAAHWNELARKNNLNVHALARGTNPDSELSAKTIAGLQKDGLSPTEAAPRKLTMAEVKSAERIITFCELPEEYLNKTPIERWDDIPPVGENYDKARAAILSHLDHLLKK
jgi:protein-tyrosine-phosphatase